MLFYCLTVVIECPYPTQRAPRCVPTAAGSLFKYMLAQLGTETEPLQKLGIVKEGYRAAVKAMSHKPFRSLKNCYLFAAGTLYREFGFLFSSCFPFYHSILPIIFLAVVQFLH